jgi:hypothetical protein
VTSCPSCAEEIELTFDAAEVRRRGGSDTPAPFDTTAGGYELTLRLPATTDLAHLSDASNIAAARRQLFARCLLGARRDGAAIDVEELPAEVIDAAAARMAELDPQADVAFEVACPSCAHAWLEPFDVVTFLWSELASTARRLLREVHQLAAAYGWSEREILALSPMRRQAYVEMLG